MKDKSQVYNPHESVWDARLNKFIAPPKKLTWVDNLHLTFWLPYITGLISIALASKGDVWIVVTMVGIALIVSSTVLNFPKKAKEPER